jgi:hypothetical protein
MTAVRRRGYPFHPVKTAGALLLGLGVFGGWLMSQTPALTAPVLNPLSTGLLAGATTLSGTGTPNSKVQVTVNGTAVGVADVNADGNWQLGANLPQGNTKIVARALQGETPSPSLESNALDLNVGASQTGPVAILDDVQILEPRVDVNAFLPNAPFLLTGTATAGETLEIFDGSTSVGKTVVGPDGRWSFTVDPSGPGDRDYSVRKSGSSSGAVLTLNIAEENGTTAACPCKLRFIMTNPRAQNAQITLTGAGTIPASQTRSVLFRGRTVQEISYPNLEAGDFTFAITQSGFRAVNGRASPPRNRALTVYLDPQR